MKSDADDFNLLRRNTNDVKSALKRH